MTLATPLAVAPIKVLIVDDSAVMRRIIRNALTAQADLEVIGTANDGEAAVTFVRRTRPDVVILDVEMPVMDGLEALREIRKFEGSLPIIMFSSLTQAGTQSTLTALINGASDYVSKPSNLNDPKESIKVLEQALIPRIRALCGRDKASVISAEQTASRGGLSVGNQKPNTPPVAKVPPQSTVSALAGLFSNPIDAVCIGVSTGGPAALTQLFSQWREPLRVPVFIVQHMPPQFTETLAAKLTSVSGMPVKEAVHGEVAVAGQGYLAPGGYHMVVKDIGGRVIIQLNQDPPENFCRPAVDVLFRSAAKVYASRLLAVVLTGMGSDGTLGAQQIVQARGEVIAQDEASSVIWGMPGAVVRAGLAQKVLPLSEIHNEINVMLARKRSSPPVVT
ncbi:MAG: chemotaxis response regulator protein-glutamate methylesterase [Alcaligenaceae bacterium]